MDDRSLSKERVSGVQLTQLGRFLEAGQNAAGFGTAGALLGGGRWEVALAAAIIGGGSL